MLAIKAQNFNSLKICLDWGICPYLKNTQGQTVLDLAQKVSDTELRDKMVKQIETILEKWDKSCSAEEKK